MVCHCLFQSTSGTTTKDARDATSTCPKIWHDRDAMRFCALISNAHTFFSKSGAHMAQPNITHHDGRNNPIHRKTAKEIHNKIYRVQSLHNLQQRHQRRRRPSLVVRFPPPPPPSPSPHIKPTTLRRKIKIDALFTNYRIQSNTSTPPR